MPHPPTRSKSPRRVHERIKACSIAEDQAIKCSSHSNWWPLHCKTVICIITTFLKRDLLASSRNEMQPHESATLPRDFRFHYQDDGYPKTPEPPSTNEPPRQPSPPRGPRLKIRRRNGSQITAPTEQFLASVAAADIPLPTIEVPNIGEDEEMPDRSSTPLPKMGFLTPHAPQPSERGISPPRTPLPQLITSMNEGQGQRRDWYKDPTTTPEDNASRPSSAVSDPSDWSGYSYFSGGQFSRRPSHDGSCTSPDDDVVDSFIAMSKAKGRESGIAHEVVPATAQNILNGQRRSKTRNDAAWSREMSEHLWQTYQIYLQDPTVTPFRIGASAVPPEGVICRVAREAKRSWRGPKQSSIRNLKNRRASSLNTDYAIDCQESASSPDTITTIKSGSITPTAELVSRTYIQWQHSSAATRNHLRELCKRKDSTSVQRYRHLQSRSPTPFTHAKPWARNSFRTPDSTSNTSFSTKDIALSLATSSAESMQHNGLLAQLAQGSGPASLTETRAARDIFGSEVGLSAPDRLRRLGSPFQSRTYGPSSSSLFSSILEASSTRPQADTLSTRRPRLRSPLRFDHSRSLNGTQKRRAQHALEEELSQNRSATRRSILDPQLFGGEHNDQQRRVRSRGFSLGDTLSGTHIPEQFGAHRGGLDLSVTLTDEATDIAPKPTTPLLPSIEFTSPRLSSPFGESGISNTFPRRLFQPTEGTSTIRRRGFATVHHTRHSIESLDFGDCPSLQSRLSEVNQRLAEIRDRESAPPKPSNK